MPALLVLLRCAPSFLGRGRTQLTRFEMQVIPLKSTAEYKKILSDFNARRFSSPSMQDEGH
jgi:hypothetical protein